MEKKLHFKAPSFLSRFCYSFASPLIKCAYRRGFLTDSDIYPITSDLDCELVADCLEQEWLRQEKKTHKPSLLRVIKICYRSFLVAQRLFDYSTCILSALRALFLYFAIQELSQYNQNRTRCLCWCSALLLCAALEAVSYNYAAYRIYTAGKQVKAASSLLIYRGVLKLRLSANFSNGEIFSLVSNDCQKFEDGVYYFSMRYAPLVQLVCTMLVYWFGLDEPKLLVFIPCAITLSLSVLQVFLSRLFARKKREFSPMRDGLTKELTDVFTGIQVVKYFAWEAPFHERVLCWKRKCIALLRSCYVVRGINLGVHSIVSMLGSFSYEFFSKATIRTEEKFMVLALLDSLARYFSFYLPRYLETSAECKAASKRISRFLSASFAKPRSSSLPEAMPLPENVAISVSDATLVWPGIENISTSAANILTLSSGTSSTSSMQFPVKRCNLTVEKGDFCMIMGPVGSGKSALLLSILGELDLIHGEVRYAGTVAYAPQSPWIIAGSWRENVVFYRPWDAEKFAVALKVAALDTDLSRLPQGADSEISDRGATLSGGQRARLSLARALYSSSVSILLLDDVLSAVDNRVGKHIVRELQAYCCQNSITCLFISHQLHFAKYCSRVLLLNKGYVKFFGTLESLQSNSRHFDFARQIVQQAEETADSQPQQVATPEKSAVYQNPIAANEKQPQETKGGLTQNSSIWNFFKRGGLSNWVFVTLLYLLSQSAISLYNVSLEKQVFAWKGATATVAAISLLLGVSKGIFLMRVCLSASLNLFSSVMKSLLRAPTLFFHENPPGAILNRITGDQSSIEEGFPTVLADAYQTICTVAVTSVSLVLLRWRFSLVLPLLFFCCAFLRRRLAITLSELKRLDSLSRSPIFSQFTNTLFGVTSIRCFNAGPIFQRRLIAKINHNLSIGHSLVFCNRWFAFRVDAMSLFLFAVFLADAIFNRSNDRFTVGSAIKSFSGFLLFLQWAFRVFSELDGFFGAVNRVEEYAQLAPEDLSSSSGQPLAVPPDNWPSSGKIEFRGVSLSFPRVTKKVLCDLHLEIPAGQRVAIVGRTGAGKSSFANGLFLVLRPTPVGSITVDGIPIDTIPLSTLRSRIAIIPQEPFLFRGTVRMNLEPLGLHSDCELWRALECAELLELIRDQPEQLDAPVNEGGSNFSAGERQLLCLARAILRKPKILVCDEVTANIDPETTEKLMAAMGPAFPGSTIITIVHRLQTVADYDRILVLESGRVIEDAPPSTLLQDPQSYFYGMVKEAGDDALQSMLQVALDSDQRRVQK